MWKARQNQAHIISGDEHIYIRCVFVCECLVAIVCRPVYQTLYTLIVRIQLKSSLTIPRNVNAIQCSRFLCESQPLHSTAETSPSMPLCPPYERLFKTKLRFNSPNVNYLRPADVGQYMVLRAQPTRFEDRKAWVEGWIESLES
jgi:hypothetical protein